MVDNKTSDSEGTVRRAFSRQILTENVAAPVETPPKAPYRRNIILDEAMGPPAPQPAFKPRNIL